MFMQGMVNSHHLLCCIQGLRVLDLGSGSGRDCYLAAALVGENGTVTGIDMTAEQLEVSPSDASS